MVTRDLMKKTFVMIPTYNEAGNIGRLVEKIRTLNLSGHELHALVVDDNSPDGTGKIVQALASQDPHVELLNRTENRGRGAAGIEGFKLALKQGADFAIEMDADF